MALDSMARWQLVRDVITQKRSGVLVLQSGINYLNWVVENGDLVCISSSFPDHSFTHWIGSNLKSHEMEFAKAQQEVDGAKALGAILIRKRLLEPEQLERSLLEHRLSCTNLMFDPAAHLFWSGSTGQLKQEFIRYDQPLGDIILRTNRSAIAVATALRVVQELKPPFRVTGKPAEPNCFAEDEKRIWMHLQSGSDLKQMFRDPEIARIPCYKSLFLFWVAGYICDSRKTEEQKPFIAQKNLLQRIPPEWTFPLCAGTLIGALLAPGDPPPEPAARLPQSRVEPLDESLQRPAWSADHSSEDPQQLLFDSERETNRKQGPPETNATNR